MDSHDKQSSSGTVSDEANAGCDDDVNPILPPTLMRTLSDKQETKTKTLIDLTSHQHASGRITEEDTDEELFYEDGAGSDSDNSDHPEEDVYKDWRAVGIA